jgi:PadR family transcriptional regulator, regulatory protein PadR
MVSRKLEWLGEFEQFVLAALLRIGPNAYGIPIWKEIQDVAGRATSLSAVYTTLERLEAKGMVSSYLGEATPERGGRGKRFFKIEAAGMMALQRSRDAATRIFDGLDRAWEGAR